MANRVALKRQSSRSMSDSNPNASPVPVPARRKYVRAVGPRLRILLLVVLGLVAILGANSAYLLSVTVLEQVTNQTYQNYFYQYMFLAHLVLGLLLILPFVIFGVIHLKNARNRPNRRAVRMGYALLGMSVVLLVSGLALMRIEGFEMRDPRARSVAYWAHIITPVLVVWLYVLHRLAGPRIKWRVGLGWAGAVGVLVVAMVILHAQDPRQWNVAGPEEGTKYFEPSLARTASGNFIPAETMMMDQYCMTCHQDAFDGWFHSAHRFSSFNNEPYLFSVTETREVALARDGNVQAARWCAGCHDPVPFFSGAFDDPDFDMKNHPTAHAGITCTACHGITHVNSTMGNADYTIEEPIHYPFAYSTNAILQWINRQLVKANPEFHKKTFLKPLHLTPEFCSTCHKVSIPPELTHYKDFLRGQNHYDTFLLSGVSGHGARSFYYPEVAMSNCADCHMPLKESTDFGAGFFNPTNRNTRYIHDHLFPAANTGIAHLRGEPDIVAIHQEFLRDSVRVDIFGVKEGGTIDSPLIAPLRPEVPALKRGQTYLIEVVLRTVTLGHPFTQGTADSNEVWVDTTVSDGARVVGRSGGLGAHNEVDPWSHFVNVYMLDRYGNRIDRRNPQDIFTPLYNNQIPPGAGQVVHYRLTVPDDQVEPLTVEVRLQYRKFDTIYMNYIYGENYTAGAPLTVTNDLPITTISTDRVVFPIDGLPVDNLAALNPDPSPIPEWQRWNDYGIGLFLKGDKGSEKGELIQAAHAFEQVERLGRPDGPLNLARVFLKEGRLDDAAVALGRATAFDPPAPRWTLAWFNGLVNKQNGFLDEAIVEFRSILEDRYAELDRRGFDFSKDYEVINELGQTYFERAKMERLNPERQAEFLRLAVEQFERTLQLDYENLTAHYNLGLIHAQRGNDELARKHRQLHERYRPDDNARDRAVTLARLRDPAADHAAQAIVIYSLQRPAAFELSPEIPAAVASLNAR
jgi:tetratricopeptide (TPR) repeat protein